MSYVFFDKHEIWNRPDINCTYRTLFIFLVSSGEYIEDDVASRPRP